MSENIKPFKVDIIEYRYGNVSIYETRYFETKREAINFEKEYNSVRYEDDPDWYLKACYIGRSK